MTPAATVGDDTHDMPIYDYRCDPCGHAFSARQAFEDEALLTCPSCGGRPRRLVTMSAIVFKGTGWYKTDSRAAASSASKDGTGEKSEKSEKSEKGEKGEKSEKSEKGEKKDSKSEKKDSASETGSAKTGEAPSS